MFSRCANPWDLEIPHFLLQLSQLVPPNTADSIVLGLLACASAYAPACSLAHRFGFTSLALCIVFQLWRLALALLPVDLPLAARCLVDSRLWFSAMSPWFGLRDPSHCPPAWVFLVVVSLGFTLCGFLGGGFGSSPGGLLLLQPFTSPLPLLHVVSLVYLASAPVPPSLLPTNMWLPHSPSSALVSSSWLIVSFSTAGGFSVT